MLDIVQEIGAVAGLAAVVGLPVLTALHVSHARDVKRLREWAGRAAGVRPAAQPPSPQRPISRRAAWRAMPHRSVLISVVGLLVFGGIAAYGVTQLTGDHSGDHSGGAQANKRHGSPNKRDRAGAAVTPGTVTVAVLNGTTVPGLAAALRDQLAAAGFKKGMINNFTDQQLAESVVEYAPGHQAEAKAVSRTVGISRREPVTADSGALAGDATVIVIAGGDKAR